MNKELTGHQILIILIGFALIGSLTGFVLKSVTSEKRTPTQIEEPPVAPPPPPPPPPTITLQDMPTTATFAIDLFINTAKNKKENIVISPYAAHSALTMIYFGSEESTKDEIGSALNLSNINDDDLKKVNQLLQEYINNSTNIEILPANSFFIKRGFIIKEEFKKIAADYFSGRIDHLPETGKNINNWIEEKTNNKINNIIGDGPISPLTTSYLLSAVYFNAPWNKEIRKDNTKRSSFNSPGGEKEVDMMTVTDSFSYIDDNEVKMISMAYKNQNFSFHIISPQEGLDKFYEAFDARKLNNLKERSASERITLIMPKFSFDNTVQLEGSLRNMNMSSVLNPSTANLTGIADGHEEAEENLFVVNFLQRTKINIEESEEEELISVDEVEREEGGVKTITIDNPFIFLIEETTTNTIILMGQIIDPSL